MSHSKTIFGLRNLRTWASRYAWPCAWSGLPVALIAFYYFRTSLLSFLHTRPDALFSAYLGFRHQTDAFLQGRLSVTDLPIVSGQVQDYAYSAAGGVQQVWGLGVPALRLPFEAAARVFGFQAFPDRLLWIFFTAIALHFLGRAILNWLRSRFPEVDRTQLFLIGTLGILLFVLSPPLIGILQTRMAVYEEAIYYSQLFCWPLVALALHIDVAPSRTKLRSLAFMCGLAALFRPTTALFSIPLALAVLWQQSRRAKTTGVRVSAISFLLLLSLGVGLTLVTNKVRFGAPFSFGHELNFSGDPVNIRMLRFGQLTPDIPIVDRVRELGGALFFPLNPNGYRFYISKIIMGQSEQIRFREFYFDNFGWVTLLLLLGCSVALVRSMKSSGSIARAPLCVASICGVLLISIFYLCSPSLTSRYLGDFSTAFSSLLFLGFAAFLKSRPMSHTRYWAMGGLALIATQALRIDAPKGLPQKQEFFYNSATIVARLPDLSQKIPALDFRKCEPDAPNQDDIKGVYYGWSNPGRCSVYVSSWFMLREAPCFEVVFKPRAPLDQIGLRVKRDLLELSALGPPTPEGEFARQKFCGLSGANPTDRIAQYSVLWGASEGPQPYPKYVSEVLEVRVVPGIRAE